MKVTWTQPQVPYYGAHIQNLQLKWAESTALAFITAKEKDESFRSV